MSERASEASRQRWAGVGKPERQTLTAAAKSARVIVNERRLATDALADEIARRNGSRS